MIPVPNSVLYYSAMEEGPFLRHTTFEEAYKSHLRNNDWIRERNSVLVRNVWDDETRQRWISAKVPDTHTWVLDMKRMEEELSGRTDFPDIPDQEISVEVETKEMS